MPTLKAVEFPIVPPIIFGSSPDPFLVLEDSRIVSNATDFNTPIYN